jgi:hypothetical protein
MQKAPHSSSFPCYLPAVADESRCISIPQSIHAAPDPKFVLIYSVPEIASRTIKGLAIVPNETPWHLVPTTGSIFETRTNLSVAET